MANFETITQRIFEEDCVEGWVGLGETCGALDLTRAVLTNDASGFIHKSSAWRSKRDAHRRRARLWILVHVEEIRADGAVAPSVPVASGAYGRRLGAE